MLAAAFAAVLAALELPPRMQLKILALSSPCFQGPRLLTGAEWWELLSVDERTLTGSEARPRP